MARAAGTFYDAASLHIPMIINFTCNNGLLLLKYSVNIILWVVYFVYKLTLKAIEHHNVDNDYGQPAVGDQSKLPGVSHHEVKVCIFINGCTNSSIVVHELIHSYLKIKVVFTYMTKPVQNSYMYFHSR